MKGKTTIMKKILRILTSMCFAFTCVTLVACGTTKTGNDLDKAFADSNFENFTTRYEHKNYGDDDVIDFAYAYIEKTAENKMQTTYEYGGDTFYDFSGTIPYYYYTEGETWLKEESTHWGDTFKLFATVLREDKANISLNADGTLNIQQETLGKLLDTISRYNIDYITLDSYTISVKLLDNKISKIILNDYYHENDNPEAITRTESIYTFYDYGKTASITLPLVD